MSDITSVIPLELRQQVAESLAELERFNKLMREAARPSQRIGSDHQGDDLAAAR